MSVRHRPVRTHLLVLLAYAAAALALTWPLARTFLTHVPGDGIDDPSLAWNLWWVKVRLVDQHNFDLFHSGWMFHPVGINLAFYTLTPLNGLLSIPIQGALGLVAATNSLALLSFVLGAYGMFLLARTVVGAHPGATAAAFAAGFLYAFAAPKLFYLSLGQFNIASSQWIPFCALYVYRMVRARSVADSVRSGSMAGLFLVLQGWAELTYASFLLIFFAVAALYSGVRIARGRAHLGTQAAGYGAAAIVFAAGMIPFLWAMLPDLRAEGDFFGFGGGFADVFSADLAGFLAPTRLHPLAGAFSASLPFPNDKGQQIFLGYLALLLVPAGVAWLWRRSRGTALLWSAAGIGFWLLSLGPSLRWMGRDLGIPGPFAWVSLLPFFNGNRYPSRYSVMILLCAGVLVAAGLLWVFDRTRGRRRALIAAAAVAVFTLEHLSIPLPTSDFRVPAIYAKLAQQPGDLAVLELPTGWRNGARVLGKSDVLIMMQQWYQTEHGKRRLGGNTSRNPAHKFQYFTEHPLIGDLIALMNADREDVRPAVEAELESMIARHKPIAAQELADLGVGWVTLHEEKSPPALFRFVEEALPLELVDRIQEPDWTGAQATIRLYRALLPASTGERTVALSEASGAGVLAQGWAAVATSPLRYANSAAPVLVAPLPPAGGTITLAPSVEGDPPVLSVDGTTLQPLRMLGDLNAWLLPAGVATEPVDRITLRFAGGGRPVTELAASPMPVGATGTEWPTARTLVVRSAGEDVGDFAAIWLDGVDVASGTRGYNLAAIGADGALLEAATFDTFASVQESERMAAWLRQWPQGTWIAGAVADEASQNLTQDAVTALHGTGVAGDLRNQFRTSHAFVGAAGEQQGAALEQVSRLRPATVWLGAPVDGARAFGGYGTLTVTPAQPE